MARSPLHDENPTPVGATCPSDLPGQVGAGSATAPPAAEAEPTGRDDRDRERAERAAGDERLFEALKLDGFQGPAWERFVDDTLARYGFRVIRGWVLTMRIFAECFGKGVKGARGSGREGRPFDDDEVTQITDDTVTVAIRSFRRVLARGGWSPSGGASLNTFFIGQCVLVFPGVYGRWQRQNWFPSEVSLSARDDDGDPMVEPADPSPTADPAGLMEVRAEVTAALQQAVRDHRTRTMLILRAEGYSDREIANLLDDTERAVEGVVYRHRQRLNSQADAAPKERS